MKTKLYIKPQLQLFMHLVWVLVLASLVSCGGSGDSKNTPVVATTVSHSYFKTATGSKSTYSSGRVDTITGNSNNRLTLKVQESGSSYLATLAVSGNAIAVESLQMYDSTGNTAGTTTFSPAWKIFPAATAVNAIETQTVTIKNPDSTSTTTCTLTVLAQENVATASSTYPNSLKIKNQCDNGMANEITWYAAGIGVVQTQDLANNSTAQLTSSSTSTTGQSSTSTGSIPAELVGTWDNSSSYYAFYADGTFYFGSLYWPDGACISTSKMQTSKNGTFYASGANLTTNTTYGELKEWYCYAPVDGSPNKTTLVKPFSSTTTWNIVGNKLTLSDGTTNGTFTFTKQ